MSTKLSVFVLKSGFFEILKGNYCLPVPAPSYPAKAISQPHSKTLRKTEKMAFNRTLANITDPAVRGWNSAPLKIWKK